MSTVPTPEGMKTPEELLAEAQSGGVHKATSDEPKPLVYEQEEIVCALTLDERQAWILMVLVGPYKDAKPDEWEFTRAAADIHRRISEAMGY